MANLHDKIEATLGGNTSIDIYPTGWDKRHALRHLDEKQIPWFVGDRCEQGGNDYPLYAALKDSGRSFKTSGPSETCEIILKIIEEIKGGKA